MKRDIPKVMAIHDLAGFGRCSLATILPVISVMGVQVCPVPTAILSTHTGGFDDIYITDYTSSMIPYTNHWQSLGIDFDCIYTGFIGSENQIEIINEIIDHFSKNVKRPLIVVDPVMADDGEVYSTYNDAMIEGMKKLCQRADVITPNLSEVSLLLDIPYSEAPLKNEDIKKYLKLLSNMGPDRVVITGLHSKEYGQVNACYEKKRVNGQTHEGFVVIPYNKIPKSYPGTGDIFASILTARLMNQDSMIDGVKVATDFIERVVLYTYERETAVREGVLFESLLTTIGDDVDRIEHYEI